MAATTAHTMFPNYERSKTLQVLREKVSNIRESDGGGPNAAYADSRLHICGAERAYYIW
jgi:hypothetical protein